MVNLTLEQRQKLMAKVIAKVWSDESFKARLIAEPKKTLEAEGFQFSDQVKQVNVVFNTDESITLVIPQKSSATEISEEDLMNLSGGGQSCGVWASVP
jgi:hypothetical protein